MNDLSFWQALRQLVLLASMRYWLIGCLVNLFAIVGYFVCLLLGQWRDSYDPFRCEP